MAKKSKKEEPKLDRQDRQTTAKKKQAFLEHLDGTYGNIFRACLSSGTSRATVYKWKNDDPDFAEKLLYIQVHAKENVLDLAEYELQKRAGIMESNEQKSDTALIFFLKTQGRARGYSDKEDNQKSKIEIEVKYDN